MSTNNLNPADLKRLFELIVKFDRLELNQRLPGAELEKFNSLGQTKLVNALLEVSWSFGGTWATLWAICEDFRAREINLVTFFGCSGDTLGYLRIIVCWLSIRDDHRGVFGR